MQVLGVSYIEVSVCNVHLMSSDDTGRFKGGTEHYNPRKSGSHIYTYIASHI